MGMRQFAQRGNNPIEPRQQHPFARVAQHQRIRKIVDVFAGAGEVHKLFGLGERFVVADLFFDEVFDRFDIVIGGRLDRLDLGAVLNTEVVGDGLQLGNLRRRKWR